MLSLYGIDIREIEKCGESDWKAWLLPERIERLNHIRQKKDRCRCIGAGVLEMYGSRLWLPKGEQPVLETGKHGKPYIRNHPELHFNLSHAGDYVVGVFADHEVGIDLADPRKCRDSLMRRCLTEKEKLWLQQQADRQTSFRRLWAAKESYIKWTGDGLRKELRELEVDWIRGVIKDLAAEAGTQERKGMQFAEIKPETQELSGYSLVVCGITEGETETGRNINWINSKEGNT